MLALRRSVPPAVPSAALCAFHTGVRELGAPRAVAQAKGVTKSPMYCIVYAEDHLRQRKALGTGGLAGPATAQGGSNSEPLGILAQKRIHEETLSGTPASTTSLASEIRSVTARLAASRPAPAVSTFRRFPAAIAHRLAVYRRKLRPCR